MKTIWLVNPYGPIEGENWRDYSFNQFGKYLSQNGYKVIWWTSNYSHHFKKYRSHKWTDIVVNENYIIKLVPTSSYKKNIGFGRFFKDMVFAFNAYNKFTKYEKPDLIISSDTPLTFSYPSFAFAKKFSIPIIYDQMDLWPEFIESVTGKSLGMVLHTLFYPVYFTRKKNYERLSGVIALGENYLKKTFEISESLKYKPNELVYNGINVKEFRGKINNPIEFKNIPFKEKDQVWCVFAGTLGPSYDIESIIECARLLENKEKRNKYIFIIAGSGPYEEKVTFAAEQINNLFFVGKLLPDELVPLYKYADIGLVTYTQKSNVDMPDKFYDYTAAGLAIINSLNGEVQTYISKNYLGLNYKAGDAKSLYDAILYVSDQEHLESMKFNSFNLGMKFDSEVQNEKLLDVIKRVIK